MTTNYKVILNLSIEEIETLRSAVLAYAKSSEVTLENFDLVKDLYGKITVWSRKIEVEENEKI